MESPPERCPTCERPLRSVLDFPVVRVLNVERLPIPEAVDTISEEAAVKRMQRWRHTPDKPRAMDDGINRTPEIARACQTEAVKEYFDQLSGLMGHEIAPGEVLPKWKPHASFKWAYPVPGMQLYLAINEQPVSDVGQRSAAVQILCDGPNMGSAGGPSLQPLGDVLRIDYLGVLQHGSA